MHDDKFYTEIKRLALLKTPDDAADFFVGMVKEYDNQLSHAYLHIGALLEDVPYEKKVHHNIADTIIPNLPLIIRLAVWIFGLLKNLAGNGAKSIVLRMFDRFPDASRVPKDHPQLPFE